MGLGNINDECKLQQQDKNGNFLTFVQASEVINILTIHRVATASKMNSSGKEVMHVDFAKLHRKNFTTFTLTADLQKKESNVRNSIFHATGTLNDAHRKTVSTAVQVDGPGVDGTGSDTGDRDQVETVEAENTGQASIGDNAGVPDKVQNGEKSNVAQMTIGDNGGVPDKVKNGDKSNVEGSTNNSVATQNQNPNVIVSESNASDTSVDTSQFADISTETDFKEKKMSILFSLPKKDPSSMEKPTLPKENITSKANKNAVHSSVAVGNKMLPRSPDEIASLKAPSKASLSDSGVTDESSLDNIFQDEYALMKWKLHIYKEKK